MQLCCLCGHAEVLTCPLYGSDGCSGDHTVKIICCRTGQCLRVLTGHRRTPWVVSQQSNRIAAACFQEPDRKLLSYSQFTRLEA